MLEVELISGCKQYNKEAQKEVYNKYASKLRVVCRRYACERYSADDILHEGFIKIYSNIKQYKGDGSFEGWMRRIMVNTAISLFRSKVKEPDVVDISIASPQPYFENDDYDEDSVFEIMQQKLSREDVLAEINNLPDSLRLVMNLYIFEDFSHKEIAEELGITIQNSKVRLLRARHQMQSALCTLLEHKHKKDEKKELFLFQAIRRFRLQKAI
jgi:RNA polymerase sigma factor (sigma-70 family)